MRIPPFLRKNANLRNIRVKFADNKSMTLLLTLLSACFGDKPKQPAYTPPSPREPSNENHSAEVVSSIQSASPTVAEKNYGMCTNEAAQYSPEEYQRILTHRSSNRQFIPAQWDMAFLQQVLDISRAKGTEVGIGFDHQSGALYAEEGANGFLPPHDAVESITLLHTHPRATSESGPVTTFSDQDLYGLMAFATAQNSEAIATVIGSICGEKMEVSQIAISKDKIYVTSQSEKDWVDGVLTKLPIPQAVLQLMAEKKIPKFQVIVDPAKVNEISARYKLSPGTESQVLATFRAP